MHFSIDVSTNPLLCFTVVSIMYPAFSLDVTFIVNWWLFKLRLVQDVYSYLFIFI